MPILTSRKILPKVSLTSMAISGLLITYATPYDVSASSLDALVQFHCLL